MKTTPNIRVKSSSNPLRAKQFLALTALLLVPAAAALAQSQWVGGTADFNISTNWNPVGVPSGTVNCTDDNGSNNVILIQPGDPVFQHGDTLAGNAAGTSGAWLQTGSTNNTGGGNWFRMALGDGSFGSYILSNGVVNVGGQTHIGERGVGYLEIDGGVFNTAQDPFCVGDGDFGPSPVGYAVMNGGTNNIASEFWIGEGNANNHGTGYFTMNGGVINVNFWWDIGRWGATGYLTMNGGTINKTGGGDCQWGAYNNGVPSSATVNMTGGTININNNLQLGTGGNGTVGGTCLFNQSGGTVHVAGQYWVGNANIQGIATNNVSGNAVVIVDNWLAVGRNGGVGTLNISGNASVTKTGVNGGNLTLSGDAGGTSLGTINQNGGTFTNTATQSWIAENYAGYYNLNAGICAMGVIHLTQNSGASGTFNLNGGDLIASEITDNGGSGTLNLNGGVLHAGGIPANPWIHDINGGVYLQPGGVTIDTAGLDVTIAAPLYDAGGTLTKIGSGTLTLSGQNSYSGATTVSAGTLATTTENYAQGNYSVADNAGFSVILKATGEQFSPANLSLGTSAGASIGFDIGAVGNPSVAPLNVTGNLALNGTITVNFADAAPVVGEFPLIQYGTKSGSGTFVLGTLPSGVTANLVPTASGLDLDITGVALDVWNGLAGGDWDIGVTTNWSNAGTGVPVFYADGDQVKFDDSVTGSTVVNLVTNVVPGSSINFNNNVTNFTLTGPGSVNGLIGLTKSGTNMLTILTTNGYTGATVLNDGTVVVSNLANGGVASAIGAATSSTNNLVFNGGTLSYGGPSITFNRGYTVAANYCALTNISTLDLQGNLTLTGPAALAPNSSFIKSGPGTLTYPRTGTNALSAGGFPGYQVIGGTVVFDGSAGTQVYTNPSEFWVGSSTNNPAPANLVLTNTTLNVQSWIAVGRGNGTSNYLSTMRMDNSTINAGNFSMGYWAGVAGNFQTQTLTMNNSKFYDRGAFNIGESAGSTATTYMNGNSIFNENGPFLCGLQSGATGAVIMADSAICTNNLWLSVGANGTGSLVMMNNAFLAEGSDFNFGDYGAVGTVGNFTIQDNAQVVLTGNGNGVFVGKSAGAIGNVIQTGGTVNARTAGVWQLAQQAGTVGTWLQSGGTNYAGGWVSIGRGYTAGDTSPNGLLVVSGGLFDQTGTGNGLIVGEQGTGTLVVTNTAVVISESQNIGLTIGWNGGIGEVDLGGGLLVANFIQSGVANNNLSGASTFNFNGGVLQAGPNARLNFMTNLTTATILSGAIIDTSTNTIAIGQSLQDGGMGGGLTKNGSGTLLLDGANNYQGNTTVTAGTLGGSGSISGAVVVNGGAVLAPGDSGIGTLTLSGTLNLAGTSETVMEVNKTANTSDLVTGASSITYGGTLVLKNLSGVLQVGDTFTLFSAGTYAGSFTSVVSQTPNQTVTWNTSQLAPGGNGTVTVASVSAAPAALASVVSGGNLNLSWPADQIGWQLQTQTNSLGVGLGTNWVNVAGSTTTNQVTLPIDTLNGDVFFRLKY
jgi:autotransporter-associated beta strand protein